MERRAGEVTVLVAEDSAAVRKTLTMAFSAMGFAIAEATTSAEALALLQAGSIDALVLDLSVAHSGGGDLLAYLRAQGGALPWLAITAADRQSASELAGDIRDRLISKPFDPWAVVDRLAGMISAPKRSAV